MLYFFYHKRVRNKEVTNLLIGLLKLLYRS